MKYEISQEDLQAIINVLAEIPAKLSFDAIVKLKQLKPIKDELQEKQ